MKAAMTTWRTVVSGLALMAAVFAQEAARGHWTGTVEAPGQPLGMEVDLDKKAAGWIGSISIPAQNVTGLPLDGINIADRKCTFRIKGGPGDPTFTGTLSENGKTMSGDFTQGPGTFPFKFTRSGEPKVESEKLSAPVAKEFLGRWEGALETGQPLRLILEMSNNDKGSQAVLTSVDQGGVKIPASAINQKGTRLDLDVKMIGGRYQAEINKDGTELTGTWSQGGNDLPLKMKKADATSR
jgi:hypothetical protein